MMAQITMSCKADDYCAPGYSLQMILAELLGELDQVEVLGVP